MAQVSDKAKQEILKRARLRCECEGANCDHHRPGTRCTNALRGIDWIAHRRVESAGDKLWNLMGLCAPCFRALRTSR